MHMVFSGQEKRERKCLSGFFLGLTYLGTVIPKLTALCTPTLIGFMLTCTILTVVCALVL